MNSCSAILRSVNRDQTLASADRHRIADDYKIRLAASIRELASFVANDTHNQAELAWLLITIDHATTTEHELAFSLASDGVNIFPKNASYRRTRGLAHQRLGRIPQAIKDFTDSWLADPSSVTAFLLAQTYLLAKQVAKGRYWLTQVRSKQEIECDENLLELYDQVRSITEAGEARDVYIE